MVYALAVLIALWAAAMVGYHFAHNSNVTAEKVTAYVNSVDLSRLSGDARARAIHKLADMLNALSLEERRRVRMERTALRWFEQMTESEKGEFIEATMPTGFKQMLTAFEALPEDKRRRTVEDALRHLREAQSQMQTSPGVFGGRASTNNPPLSEELQAKVRMIGLKSFYSQSSPQTKAELQPVLEEMQRVMESGRLLHGPR
jgi:hypothetical protein